MVGSVEVRIRSEARVIHQRLTEVLCRHALEL
jgi:hypothetical protein